MVRIPQNIAGGRLETGPMVDYSGIGRSPVGAALQGLGADLQGASDTMVMAQQRYQAQQEEAENFEATQSFNRFKIAAQGEVTEIAQKVPVNGLGFHDQSVSAFDKRRQEFIATVPERLRPKFDQLLQTERDMFSQRQAGAELEQRQKWYRDGLGDAVSRGQEQVYNDPTAWEAAKQEALRSVDASGLPEVEKADWRKKVEQGLATSLATRELAANPSGLVGALGVAVQREASGAVVLPSDPNLPAGMRNNNPGNIKFIGQGKDQGVLGPSKNTDQGDPQAVFATPEAGMAAAYKLALKKYGDGRKTANQIIAGERGWTPGNTKAAENVARGMGLGPDDDLNLSDPQRAQSFLRALVRQEHGPASDAYTDELITGAISGKATAAGAKADVVFGQSNQIASGQGYLQVAQAFIGANENQDADVLASFIKKSTGTTLDPRQTAWCAAYVNAVLGSQGVQGTGSLAARSFLDFGEATDKPSMGDIVVLSRGAPGSGKGHVGFFAGYDANGNVKILGGNQSQAVNVSSYPPDQVLGFRRPPSVGSTEEANARLAKLPGGGPSGGMVVTELDPRFASLPFAERLKLSSQAQQQTIAQQQAAVTQQKAQYTAFNESINLGIVTGEISSEEQILTAGLDDGDTAARLTQFRAQQKEASETDLAVRDYLAGGLAELNPLDTDQRATANKVYDVLQKNMTDVSPEAQTSVQNEFIQRTQVVPDPIVADIRRGMYSNNPQEFAAVMDRAASIDAVAPVAFDNLTGGEQIKRDLTSFRNMVNNRGMSSSEAAQRLIERRSEDYQRNESVLGPAADKAVKGLEVSDLTSEFATGILGFGQPGAGADPTTQNRLLAEYSEAFREEFIRSGGDEDEAKAQAARLLKKTWGESTISGERQLMKYPPEQFYRSVPPEILREDAMATAADFIGEGAIAENVFLRPDEKATAADIRAKRPPRYRLFYMREVDGQPVVDQVPGMWGMDPATADQRKRELRDAEMGRADTRRGIISQQQDILEAGEVSAEEALTETVGPDWMKARSAEAAREQARTKASTVNLPQVTVQGSREAIQERLGDQRRELIDNSPDLETSFGSAM